ncbi:unnamed protein product, partial [Allacma fusca]
VWPSACHSSPSFHQLENSALAMFIDSESIEQQHVTTPHDVDAQNTPGVVFAFSSVLGDWLLLMIRATT